MGASPNSDLKERAHCTSFAIVVGSDMKGGGAPAVVVCLR